MARKLLEVMTKLVSANTRSSSVASIPQPNLGDGLLRRVFRTLAYPSLRDLLHGHPEGPGGKSGIGRLAESPAPTQPPLWNADILVNEVNTSCFQRNSCLFWFRTRQTTRDERIKKGRRFASCGRPVEAIPLRNFRAATTLTRTDVPTHLDDLRKFLL